MSGDPSTISSSILTAQTMVHHRLYDLGDHTHDGVPRECTRPICARLLSDAEDVKKLVAP